MQKFKKGFMYLLGALLAFLFKANSVVAADPYGGQAIAVYGVRQLSPKETIWQKVLAIVISPFFWIIITGLAVVIGIILYIIRLKGKKVKKF